MKTCELAIAGDALDEVEETDDEQQDGREEDQPAALAGRDAPLPWIVLVVADVTLASHAKSAHTRIAGGLRRDCLAAWADPVGTVWARHTLLEGDSRELPGTLAVTAALPVACGLTATPGRVALKTWARRS